MSATPAPSALPTDGSTEDGDNLAVDKLRENLADLETGAVEDRPVHKVTLSDYYIMETEASNALIEKFLLVKDYDSGVKAPLWRGVAPAQYKRQAGPPRPSLRYQPRPGPAVRPLARRRPADRGPVGVRRTLARHSAVI